MSELFPLVLAQAGTGLVALGVSGLGWWRASRASKALKESFSAHEVSNAEIERFLMALSQAEREGTTAMLQVLENHTSKPAEYFRSLAAARRSQRLSFSLLMKVGSALSTGWPPGSLLALGLTPT